MQRIDPHAIPMNLTRGVDSPSSGPGETHRRMSELVVTVEHYLPHFAKGVKQLANAPRSEQQSPTDGPTMLLHQDGFAAGYDHDEYVLCGMAVKYAGLHGVHLQIIGKNHETF